MQNLIFGHCIVYVCLVVCRLCFNGHNALHVVAIIEFVLFENVACNLRTVVVFKMMVFIFCHDACSTLQIDLSFSGYIYNCACNVAI